MNPVSSMQYTSLAEQRGSANTKSKSIFISHFISTWNSRGFEFGAVLFLSTIYPGTLLQISIYALLRALAAIVFSPAVGRYIDQKDRLVVVRNSIIGQRMAVALSCAVFLCMLNFADGISRPLQHLLFACLIVLACIEKLCIIMNTISVERDWVVVVSDNDENWLQHMNSQMRRIDLFCKLVSPLAIALLDGYSSAIAIVVTLAINSTSVVGEYFLIAYVYQSTPSLSQRSETVEANVRQESDGRTQAIMAQLKSYVKSHAFLPSFSLSLLFLTVLSFSGQMVTYLFAIDRPHLTSIHIGIMRTISTVLEISATFITPLLIERVGAVRAGIWSLSWQALCLVPAVMTFWTSLKDLPELSTYTFVIGVMLSRMGLWSFDLTAQLLVQNSVDAGQRGSFSATESSTQNLFELGTFAMTIIWSKPDQFKYPAIISLGAVFAAAACYSQYVRVERGHLLHLELCCRDNRYKKVAVDDVDIELIEN